MSVFGGGLIALRNVRLMSAYDLKLVSARL